jgi:hypothetical protein
MLLRALRASWVKIFVFLYVILSPVIIFGSLMYVIESAASGAEEHGADVRYCPALCGQTRSSFLLRSQTGQGEIE